MIINPEQIRFQGGIRVPHPHHMEKIRENAGPALPAEKPGTRSGVEETRYKANRLYDLLYNMVCKLKPRGKEKKPYTVTDS